MFFIDRDIFLKFLFGVQYMFIMWRGGFELYKWYKR